jgi:hypothetical protein
LNNVYSRIILRACQILGGPEQLAVRLGMSHLLVKAMLKGTLVPPPPVFLKVVDILMAFDGRDITNTATPVARRAGRADIARS